MKKETKESDKNSTKIGGRELNVQSDLYPSKILKTKSLNQNNEPLSDLTYTLPGKIQVPELDNTSSPKNENVCNDLVLTKRKTSNCSEIEIALARKPSRRSSDTLGDPYLSSLNSNRPMQANKGSKFSTNFEDEYSYNDQTKNKPEDWPYASYEKVNSSKNQFQDRINFLREIYSSMSNKDIIYQGAAYMQNLAKKQKDYSKADETINSYFDSRKDRLSKLLDRL